MTVNHVGDISPQFAGAGVGFGPGLAVVPDVGKRGVPGFFGEYCGGACHPTYWVDPEEDRVITYMSQLRPAT